VGWLTGYIAYHTHLAYTLAAILAGFEAEVSLQARYHASPNQHSQSTEDLLIDR